MRAPEIERRSLLAGAQGISGPAIVIDTFRAFTTAAHLFNHGIAHIVLAETLDEARDRSASIPGSLLCGEEGGRKPDDFDIGNSPTEVSQLRQLDGEVAVMRTSAGTRAVVAVLLGEARPVYAASLVVAGATAATVADLPRVTIVAAGLSGESTADEDEETAGLIADRLRLRRDDPNRLTRIRSGEGAERLRSTPWIDSHDLDLCLDIDRFSFAMRTQLEDGVPVLRPE
ncbi:MAG: 2-phosphosulfolactate phosphatase [Actinomycetota bacterium]